jgi:hypothetical protein
MQTYIPAEWVKKMLSERAVSGCESLFYGCDVVFGRGCKGVERRF